MSTLDELNFFKFGDTASSASGADIAQKQEELRHATDVRIKTLEAQLRQREMEVEHEKNTVKTLTADFEYNLGLIRERDDELEKFEEAMETMKLAVAERDQEAVDVRQQLDTANKKIKSEQKRCLEMETHYQEQLLQFKAEKDALRSKFEGDLAAKDDELRRLSQEMLQQRGDMFEEVSGKLQAQMASSTQEARERESEWRRNETTLQQQLSAKTELLAEARLDAQKLEQNITNLREASNRLGEELAKQAAEHEQALAGAIARSAEAEALRVERDRECARVEGELRAKADEAAAAAQALKDAELLWAQQRQELEKAGASTQEALAAGGQREAQLANEVDALKTTVETLRGAEEEARREAGAMRDALSAQKLDAHKARIEAQAFEKEIAGVAEERGRLREENVKITSERADLEKQLSLAKLQLEKEEAKAAKLEASEADLTRVRAQLRESETLRRKEATAHDTTVKNLERKLHDATPVHLHHTQNTYQHHHMHGQGGAGGMGMHPTPQHNISLGFGGVQGGMPGSGGSGFPQVPHMDLSSGSEAYPPVSPVLGFSAAPGGGGMGLNANGGAPTPQGHMNQIVDLRSQVQTLQAKNRELSEQNARIRQQVRQFTEEMAAEPIVKRTAELQEEVDALRKQLNAANREITSLQAELMDKEREGLGRGGAGGGGTGEQQDLIVKLTTELLKLKEEADASRRRAEMLESLGGGGGGPNGRGGGYSDGDVYRHGAAGGTPSPRAGDRDRDRDVGSSNDAARYRRKYEKLKQVNHALSKENAELRARMSQAKEDLKRLLAEKESLLEINNMMRADLHKLAIKDTPHVYSGGGTSTMMASRFGRGAMRAVTRHQLRAARPYCTESGEKKETPASKEDELTAHFRLPNKGDGPEKVVYDLAEKVLSLNVLQFRLFQKIINEAMGKSEMWEYDLVMNLAKGMASGGGGGGGAFMMNPAMMANMQAGAAAPAAAAPAAEEAEEEAPVEAVKEQTEFDVKLTQIDPEKKVKAIKVLKEALKMSLKEAKEKVEGVPSVIATAVSKADAEKLIEELKGVGASAAAI